MRGNMADDENIRITVRKTPSPVPPDPPPDPEDDVLPKLKTNTRPPASPAGPNHDEFDEEEELPKLKKAQAAEAPPVPPRETEPSALSSRAEDELERRALLKLKMYEQEHNAASAETSPMRKRYFRIGCLTISVLFSFLPLLFLQNCGGKDNIRKEILKQIHPPENLREEFEILGFGEQQKPAPAPPLHDPAPPEAPPEAQPAALPLHDPAPPAEDTRPAEALRRDLNAKSRDVKDLYLAFKRFLKDTPCEGENIRLYLDLKEKFTAAGMGPNFLEWCRAWAEDNPLSVPANRLAAEVLPEDKAAIYWRRVCINSLAKPEEEPYIRLIELYRKAGNWEKAAEHCDSMLLAFPGNEWAARTRAELRIRRGADPKLEFEKLQEFTANFSPAKRAFLLLPFAIDFLPENVSSGLLGVPGLREADPVRFRCLLFRHALTFRRDIPPEELTHAPQTETERKLLLLYRVSRGEYLDAMKLPTPEHAFPDFFKIYVYWRKKEFPDMRRTAKMYLEKQTEKSGRVPAEILLCELWSGKRKLKDVRADAEKFPPPERALLLFLLSEEYRRAGSPRTARILREKADQGQAGIYNTLLKNQQ